MVGFERRIYTVNEGDGQVQLCVNITVPRRQDIGTVTFNLTVETQDGTAGIIETVQILLTGFNFSLISLLCTINIIMFMAMLLLHIYVHTHTL